MSPEAVERFERRHGRIFRACARKWSSWSREDAEDAFQSALVQLLRFGPDDEANVAAWFNVTLRRECWRVGRRHQRESPYELPELAADDDPAAVVEDHERLASLRDLPLSQRRALLLTGAGYSYREQMAAGGLTYRQVNRHLVKARRAVREAGLEGAAA